MDVYIISRGRAQPARQYTLNRMLAEGMQPTLVVPANELADYSSYHRVVGLPAEYDGISATRDWALQQSGDSKVLMLDDDLVFFARRSDERDKFRDMLPGEFSQMIRDIAEALDTNPHVGVASREGGNRNTEDRAYNTRTLRLLAYDREYLNSRGITFMPMRVMEDFHVSLQILKSGADICVLNNWCHNQAEGSNAPGGCSSYRQMSTQAEAAHELARRHAPFVRVVQKKTKTAWGGAERTDVVISWKKARNA